MNKRYLQVALPVPLRRHYDYVIGEPFNHVEFLPGMRVSVPFGRRKEQVGMALAVSDRTALRPGQLKSLGNVIDYEPLFSQRHFELLCWAADYYHYPVGEALFSALPALLRQGKGLSGQDGEALTASTESVIENRGFDLNPQQIQAIDAITANTDAHGAHLLQGVTGSGKTEVYIEVVRRVIAQDRQALILVPEIGLTTQFIDRLRQRLPVDIRVQHSALSETERLRNWLAAKNGTAPVIIGTRSAVWTPLKSPGIYVVDEEHDTSYKQDSGFRYSARDIAVVRGKFDSVPVVLGSATPSLETLKNVKTRKFSQQNLPARASGAASPEIRIINLRNETLSGAVSKTLLDEISATLDRNNQVLLFLNRRGYAPVILCHSCGWYAECSRCSAKMTFHKDKRCLMCHHCDSRRALPVECPDCNQDELIEVGHGTQRLDRTLAEHFPGANILRIDRDSTRRKGSMEKMIREITTGDADILIGTQMLAKGHHFPRLTLVGIIDADAGLLSTDFRASERMAQLIVQVSGRAGREDRPGAVYIQTHFPIHPLLQTLVTRGYAGFAGLLLSDRRNTHLPPYAYLALLGAEATSRETAEKFLREARAHLNDNNALNIFGPVAAPIEKRRGRYRSQLLIQSGNRNALRKVLAPWCRSLESMPGAKRTRWFLDIDPQDML
ncbi:MAG: primosomal protein N' [Gammaproteobacteria bacterium]|nr:primosomal protein N' [Gammaproteobacteria bacterium]MDE0512651.1 primosomal protein N' [Gammaproteobacteria bacterium]